MISAKDDIIIKGARANNLKNIDVEIPRGKLVVITGVSGSGKSSLAFDTLYAEGQRRYVESLSAYARQFLGRMAKPEVDSISGLPPAIAVEQKVKTRTSRSTVGTSTEIYDYLRLLFARIGKTYSPVSGREVKCHTVKDVIDYIAELPEDSKAVLTSPISADTDLQSLKNQGFSRLYVNGEFVRIDDYVPAHGTSDNVALVVERFTVKHEEAFFNRMADSVETAFYEGKGVCHVNGVEFSTNFEVDGIRFEPVDDKMFNFNSPVGACPTCQGFGTIIGIDENLVVPDKSLSIYEGAIACWRGEKMGEYRKQLILNAEKFGFPIHKPYYLLSPEQKLLLWTGNEYFEGLNSFFNFLNANQYKVQYRVLLSRYRGRTVCPDCHGTRLRKQAMYVKVCGKTIQELVEMSVSDLRDFFSTATFGQEDQKVADRLLAEINSRLQYLCDVGLGYLTLSRASNTLSGGESQRINLAGSLGSSLVGSLYILDEPSIGLHARNTDLLIGVLCRLRDIGNTVVVVEHDENIMRAADYIIDIGPAAGRAGGNVVFAGTSEEAMNADTENYDSATLRYLQGKDALPIPKQRRKWSNYIEIKGVTQNNLKNVDVKFPLGVMTVVTGVSGSGKSTLVSEVFYPALKRELGMAADAPGSFASLSGSLSLVKDIEFVDQNPIGKSSRSNPCIYLKAFDEIRRLFSEQQLAKQYGFDAGYFTFNSRGGRCEHCKGEGIITVPMQFMSDVRLECEFCHGKRFKQEVLDIKYRDKNICDVLEMTVNQAIEFFSSDSDNSTAGRVVKRLLPLQQVGLGYIKLGQSSNTLSGGESQRVKLAAFIGSETSSGKIYVFDEPTTGLHFADIKVLMASFNRLIDMGNTLIIIEHNMDLVAQADHIIDLGPDGGENGGNVVFVGTPEELAKCDNSVTAKYLHL